MDAISALGDISTSTTGAMPPVSTKLNPNANIDKTAQDFESMFATQMLEPMFEGIGVDPMFGGGHGEEVMKSFMLQEYGKIIAKTGKLGIASQVKSEMLHIQETARARNGVSAAQAANSYADAAPLSTVQGATNVAH